jgi:hypothetical protein
VIVLAAIQELGFKAFLLAVVVAGIFQTRKGLQWIWRRLVLIRRN